MGEEQGHIMRRARRVIPVVTGCFLIVVSYRATAEPLRAFVCEINEQQKLTLLEQRLRTGFSAVAVVGDVAVVGATGDSITQSQDGSVSVFCLNDSGTPANPHDDVWIRMQRFGAPDGVSDDLFGCSVGVSGEWIVVGACRREVPFQDSGAVYLFRHDDGNTPGDCTDDSWPYFQTLISPNPSGNGVFGVSVGIAGDYIVIGAHQETVVDEPRHPGAAHVFRYVHPSADKSQSGDVWVAQSRLLADRPQQGGRFGQSVAIDGDHVIVGSPRDSSAIRHYTGAAYVFRRDDAGTPSEFSDDAWVPESKLIPTDAGQDDNIGAGVAIDGDWVVVGVPGHDAVASGAGAAYVYRRNDRGTPEDPTDDVWAFRWKLLPPRDTAGDVALFGLAVTMNARYVLVGAPYLDEWPLENNGGAYLFFHDDRGTPETLGDDLFWDFAEFRASDEATDDRFGGRMFMSDEHVAIAAPGKDDACPENIRCESGAVYFFNVGEDCNGNDFPDACDTTEGFSLDCNANVIPDECAELEPDENNNEVPDECEIPGDCNLNLTIDSWDQLVQTICISTGGPDVGIDQPCQCADADADGDVDLRDVALYQNQVGR